MSLEIATIRAILSEHQLLVEIDGNEPAFTGVNYDSRKVRSGDLFFCKGNFKADYLKSADQKGATGYVAEQKYTEGTGMTAVIVKDVTKAMAVLSASFYKFPQQELFVIGVTGTKGKTSTAYFAHSILNNAFPQQVALFSTIDRIIGPKPEHQFKSDLTTPESLDLFHDMRESVNNGMKYLVMEVSSQSYLRNRVYGLKFNVGIFLNISPDHIGRNEHKDFADYLHCKLQLLVNSEYTVIDAGTAHFDEVYGAAKATTDPDKIFTFDRDNRQDFEIQSVSDTLQSDKIKVIANTKKAEKLSISGSYQVNVPGDYNQLNALAALIASGLAGAKGKDAVEPLSKIVIPGRMEHIKVPNHGTVFVDYAHNYASLRALLNFLHSEYTGKSIVVLGAPGDKGISRRAGFGQALDEEADVVYLTTDDPGFEDPNAILDEIEANMHTDRVKKHRILDRATAIEAAIESSAPADVVVLAGKGEDPYQKVRGVDTPYPTDMKIAENIMRRLDQNGKTNK